jgi:hypothetical protein
VDCAEIEEVGGGSRPQDEVIEQAVKVGERLIGFLT